MAKKKAASGAAADAGGKGHAATLPAAGTAESGVPLHSGGNPQDSKATTLKAAIGIEEPEREEHKGKPVRIKSRVPRYTALGRTFRNDDEGPVYWPGDFSDEQWKALRANPNVVISKAPASDE